MSAFTALAILGATLVTAFISGIFGMAGGLILMGVLTALVPVATAMILHGSIQMVSNGYRAFLWRHYIDWGMVARYAVGAVAAVVVLFGVSWRPDERAVYVLLGLTAMLVWLPNRALNLDIQARGQAVLAGFLVQGLNTLAGVAGPLLDVFFVRTDMSRQAVVATKAITQVLAHAVKIVFWSWPVLMVSGLAGMPPVWLLALAIPLSMTGTRLGGVVLERMTDTDFRAWMKGLVTAVGLVCFARASGMSF